MEREVILAKVVVEPAQKGDLERIVKAFNGALIDVSDTQSIIEMSGSSEKIDELLKSLSGIKIIEIARSGVTGLSSSEGALCV